MTSRIFGNAWFYEIVFENTPHCDYHTIFFGQPIIAIYDSFGWCCSLEVCIILTVTNAGNVETDIIGVHNSAEPWSAHTYTRPCKYWGILFCEQILITILCNTKLQFYTSIKVALHIDWDLIFIIFESEYKFYVWFDFTELMTGCQVNESCRSDKSCEI